jgi:glutathione peroxidase
MATGSPLGKPVNPAYDIGLTTIDGRRETLAAYAGKVLLVVNLASRCVFTPQYDGLEALWRSYRERGFAVLGFPCGQFGGQEPGVETQIAEFCAVNYNVTFPLFAKTKVNGPHAHPLFRTLTNAAPGIFGTAAIKWNFTKFLIDRQGAAAGRYAPTDRPEDLAGPIEALLNSSGRDEAARKPEP